MVPVPEILPGIIDIVIVETIKQILPIIEITINRLMLLYYLHP